MGKVRKKWSSPVRKIPYVPMITRPAPYAPTPCYPVYPSYPVYPNPLCLCGKPLLLYTPPGQYARPCPVHPDHVLYAPYIVSVYPQVYW